MTNRALIELTVLGLLVGGCWLLTRLARQRSAKPDGGYPSPREFDFDLGSIWNSITYWTTTTNHRDIGKLYIVFGTFAALWGGIEAMMMRTELLTPNASIWSTETYNALFTSHGLTMLFFFVTPVFFGIANYFLPLLIGADDMAFPRLNAIGFWLLPPSLLLVRGGLPSQVVGQFLDLVGIHGPLYQFFWTLHDPELGWTLYTPLATQSTDPQVNFLLLGLHLSGIATTLGAINFIVTIFYEREEGLGMGSLDIFGWNMLVTSALIIFAFPLLGSAAIMMLLDRVFGTTFYAASGGGPMLWQNLFWFFGHPEVYIIFLPAAGLMSFILPKFAGRKLFGFNFIVYSTMAIGVLSFGVWAHHMFVTGMDPRLRASFMAVSVAIAVPSAIKTFNWITTIWSGEIRLTAPMVLCISSIGTFVVGGVTGVFLAAIPIDIVLHGTYYVVGHFHLILMGIIPFMMIAASYYWYPILTERMYDRQLALFQSLLFVVGSIVTFGTMIILGLLNLPRRYAIYPPEFASFQRISTIGAYLIGLSVLLWLYNMLWSYWNGTPVTDADVWGLKRTNQFTREWQWFERRLEAKYGIEPTEPETTRAAATDVPSEGSPNVFQGVRSLGVSFPRVVAAAAISGLIGTVLMSGVLFTAAVLNVFSLSSFVNLSGFVGQQSVVVGYLLFLIGGMTTWALLFAVLAEYLPGRPRIVTGLAFATVIAVGFALAFYTGQTGLHLLAYVVFVLIAHWFYGLGLSATFEYLTERWQVTE